MTNTQPIGKPRHTIASIIGDEGLFALESAGFVVMTRSKRKEQRLLLKFYREENKKLTAALSTLTNLQAHQCH